MRKILLEIKVEKDGGVLSYSDLSLLRKKVSEVVESSGYDALYIISGRLPVWAYTFLAHLLHPVKGIAVYEPRSNMAIIVSRHVADIPAEGSTVTVDDAEKKEVIL